MTNNPAKLDGLTVHGVEVIERVPLHVGAGPSNRAYLRAKRDLMGHLIETDGEPGSTGRRVTEEAS
jgi:3,4-dihydroxy 2-butanone 4-phosphate synthase/GTP cyclohydrolase II